MAQPPTTTSHAILCLLAVRDWTAYELAQQMDRSVGNMWPRAASVVYEHPAGAGFGKQAVGPIRDAFFIPGFRNGKRVSCQFNWTFIFLGPGRQMGSG